MPLETHTFVRSLVIRGPDRLHANFKTSVHFSPHGYLMNVLRSSRPPRVNDSTVPARVEMICTNTIDREQERNSGPFMYVPPSLTPRPQQ